MYTTMLDVFGKVELNTLVSTIVGALLALIPTLTIWLLNNFVQSHRMCRSIRAAFHAEISGILEEAKRRDEVAALYSAIKQLEAGGEICLPSFVDEALPLDPVYEAHVDRIGLLRPKLARGIVSFYRQLKSIRFDLREITSRQRSLSKDLELPRLRSVLARWQLLDSNAQQLLSWLS